MQFPSLTRPLTLRVSRLRLAVQQVQLPQVGRHLGVAGLMGSRRQLWGQGGAACTCPRLMVSLPPLGWMLVVQRERQGQQCPADTPAAAVSRRKRLLLPGSPPLPPRSRSLKRSARQRSGSAPPPTGRRACRRLSSCCGARRRPAAQAAPAPDGTLPLGACWAGCRHGRCSACLRWGCSMCGWRWRMWSSNTCRWGWGVPGGRMPLLDERGPSRAAQAGWRAGGECLQGQNKAS